MHSSIFWFNLSVLLFLVLITAQYLLRGTVVPIKQIIAESDELALDPVFYANDWTTNDYDDYNYDDEDEFQGSNHKHGRLLKRKRKRDANYEAPRYFQSCGRTYQMKPNKKINIVSLFHGEKQFFPGTMCDWNFYGSSKCTPQITCQTIDLRPSPDCGEEHLIIFDGIAGWVKLCEDASAFTKPIKPSQGGNLFVIFKAGSGTSFSKLFQGIRCQVSCDTKGDAEKLPEKNGLFKIEEGCECGIKAAKASARIVGGAETDPFEFPWIVVIVRPNTRTVHCGGALINSQFVLTASHCFAPRDSFKTFKNSKDQVILHAHNLRHSDAEESSVRSSISRVICHPHYGRGVEFSSDYCILKLETEINIIDHRPICLPPFDVGRSALYSKTMTVAGWGALSEARAASTTLQRVDVPAISEDVCMKDYGKEKLSERMLCAGFAKGVKDSCQGDSGGPLMRTLWVKGQETKVEQVGIVSWGEGCARQDQPGVYSYVSAVIPWIQKTALNGTWCKAGSRT